VRASKPSCLVCSSKKQKNKIVFGVQHPPSVPCNYLSKKIITGFFFYGFEFDGKLAKRSEQGKRQTDNRASVRARASALQGLWLGLGL